VGRFHPPGRLTVPQILAATGGELIRGSLAGSWTVCTDTREMSDDALFVALRGEIHDGHDWIGDLGRDSRAGLLVEELPEVADALPAELIVRVPDTLVGLGALARGFLLQTEVTVAGVTGSVGKTTTRSMLGSILAQLGPGLVTEGNFNNRIGLPLTLLALRPEHRWAVLEMGMSEPGEIRALASICRPRVRVITTVSAGHLEFFDSVDGIADAKGEIFEDARPGDALVYELGAWFADRLPRPPGAVAVTFGAEGASVWADQVVDEGLAGTRANLYLYGEPVAIHVPLPGAHQLHNAMAAAAAALWMGADASHIAAGLARAEVPGRRMRVEEVAGVTVIDDAYNANPASVLAALKTAASARRSGRLVVAIGDMLELGPDTAQYHATALAYACERLPGARILPFGPLMAQAVRSFDLDAFEDIEDLRQHLTTHVAAGDLIAVKGSRGMALERLIP